MIPATFKRPWGSPQAGLDRLAQAAADRRLEWDHRPEAVRAHLKEMAGERERAREAYLAATRRTTGLPQQRYPYGGRPAWLGSRRPALTAGSHPAAPRERSDRPVPGEASHWRAHSRKLGLRGGAAQGPPSGWTSGRDHLGSG